MKRLQCEMCNSNDIIKQDGYYICQYCGTKYTVEEAKKMMIEGTVDIQGTVRVDVSEKVKNLYVMARRAKDDNNAELASKYYEMITFENPNDWEALFYFNYFKAWQTTLLNMRNSVISFSNSLDSVFELIKQSDRTAEEKWSIVSEIVAKIDTYCDTCISTAKSHFREFAGVTGQVSQLDERMFAIANLQKNMANLLEKHFRDQSSQLVANYLKSYVKNYLLLDTVGRGFVNITLKHYSNELIEAEERIKNIDTSYVPQISRGNRENNTAKKSAIKVGAIVGAIIGLIIGGLYFSICNFVSFLVLFFSFVFIPAVGALLGGAIAANK